MLTPARSSTLPLMTLLRCCSAPRIASGHGGARSMRHGSSTSWKPAHITPNRSLASSSALAPNAAAPLSNRASDKVLAPSLSATSRAQVLQGGYMRGVMSPTPLPQVGACRYLSSEARARRISELLELGPGKDDGSFRVASNAYEREVRRRKKLQRRGGSAAALAAADAMVRETRALRNERLYDPANAAEKEVRDSKDREAHQKFRAEGRVRGLSLRPDPLDARAFPLCRGDAPIEDHTVAEAKRAYRRVDEKLREARLEGASKRVLTMLERDRKASRKAYRDSFEDPRNAEEVAAIPPSKRLLTAQERAERKANIQRERAQEAAERKAARSEAHQANTLRKRAQTAAEKEAARLAARQARQLTRQQELEAREHELTYRRAYYLKNREKILAQKAEAYARRRAGRTAQQASDVGKTV